jgi:hypothetical protein
VVPGPRREASTASAGDEGHREAACGIDRTWTRPPPGAETGATTSMAAPKGASGAGTEADLSASQEARANQAPGPTTQAEPRPARPARAGRRGGREGILRRGRGPHFDRNPVRALPLHRRRLPGPGYRPPPRRLGEPRPRRGNDHLPRPGSQRLHRVVGRRRSDGARSARGLGGDP